MTNARIGHLGQDTASQAMIVRSRGGPHVGEIEASVLITLV
jgi:hypothetical protein